MGPIDIFLTCHEPANPSWSQRTRTVSSWTVGLIGGQGRPRQRGLELQIRLIAVTTSVVLFSHRPRARTRVPVVRFRGRFRNRSGTRRSPEMRQYSVRLP